MNASNFIIAYKILRDISTKWVDYPAFKIGLIDEKGTKLKSPSTPQEKDAYDSYWKIVFNLKRILQRFVGKNTIVQSIATAFLLKEGIEQTSIDIIVKKLDLRDFEKADPQYVEAILERYMQDFNEPETKIEWIIYNQLKDSKMINIKKAEFGDAYYATCMKDGKIFAEYDKVNHCVRIFNLNNRLIRSLRIAA